MKKTESSEEYLDPLRVLKIVTMPIGIWPLSDDLFSLFRTFLAIAIQMSLVICVTIEITLGCCTTEEKIDLIEFQKFGTIAALKVISLRYYRKNVEEILSSAGEDWLRITEPKMRDIMITHKNLGKIVFYAQAFSTASIISLQTIPSISISLVDNVPQNNSEFHNLQREYPIPTRCLFINTSTISFLLICILQTVQLISTAFGNVGVDIFLFNLSMHICARLEVLSEEMSEFEGTSDIKWTKLKIIGLIKRHRYLWREARTVRNTFSSTILMQLFINITGICSYGIQGIVNMQMYGVLAGMKSFFAVELLLMQLFLYCYAGEKLSSKILKLSLATYQSSWYKLPNTLSQDLYFIIMAADKPFSLTAGKMLSMNLNTFTGIVKSTFSFFSFLRLMLAS